MTAAQRATILMSVSGYRDLRAGVLDLLEIVARKFDRSDSAILIQVRKRRGAGNRNDHGSAS